MAAPDSRDAIGCDGVLDIGGGGRGDQEVIVAGVCDFAPGGSDCDVGGGHFLLPLLFV